MDFVQLHKYRELFREWQLDVDKAEDFAQMVHLHQKRRNNKPFIIHPKRLQILARGLGYDKEIQIIALLHDTIEDSENPLKIYNNIKSLFGETVANVVKLLSHDKSVSYEKYLLSIVKSNNELSKKAFKVKMIDMYDNLLDAPTNEQLDKYKNAILLIINNGFTNLIPKKILQLLNLTQYITEADKDTGSSTDSTDSGGSEKNNTSDTKSKDTNTDKGPEKDPPKEKPKSPDKGSQDNKSNTDGGEPDLNPDATGDDTGDSEDTGEGDGLDDLSGAGGAGGMDSFGDKPNADGEDTGDEEQDQGEPVQAYVDKTNDIKYMKSQKKEGEPGFEFDAYNEFYRDNYVGVTDKGSCIIGVPHVISNNRKYIDFLKNIIINKINPISKGAVESGKKIILLGDMGYPYKDGKFQNNEQGIIAKFLYRKYKKDIKFGYWNYDSYNTFSNDKNFISQIKSTTGEDELTIKTTVFLEYYLISDNKSGLTDEMESLISEWGLNLNNKDDIIKYLYPEEVGNIANPASYIIDVYTQESRKKMLKSIIRYEKQGNIVIVPTNKDTAWALNNTFKNLYKKVKVPSNKDNTNDKKEPKK